MKNVTEMVHEEQFQHGICAESQYFARAAVLLYTHWCLCGMNECPDELGHS